MTLEPYQILKCQYCDSPNISFLNVVKTKETILIKEYLFISIKKIDYEYNGKYRCNDCREIFYHKVLRYADK